MSPLQQFWHLANFLIPALATAIVATSLAKLLWRHELADRRWWVLVFWSALAGEAAMIAGWIVTGRDGAMASYIGMAVAVAVALWCCGIGWRRGGRV